MRSIQIKMNMLWNGISVMISTVISFLLTPYITNNLGIEASGFVSLSNTIVSYVDIIAIALNAFGSRNIGIAYHNGDIEEANKYYSSLLIANILFSGLISIILFMCILRLEFLLNISDYLINDVKILFFLVLLNYTLNLFSNIFSIGAFVKNKISITYRNKGFSSILYAVILAVLLYLWDIKVYYAAIGHVIATLFCIITNYLASKRIIPELEFRINYFSIKKVLKLITSGIWNSISNIGVLLNTGLDLLVTNKMLTNIVMGQISITKQLSSIMTTVTSIVVNAFQPKQLQLYAQGDEDALVNNFGQSIKLTSILCNVIFSCFFVMGVPFLNLWIPGQDAVYIYKLCLIVFLGDIVVAIARPLYYVFTLTDNLRITCFITLFNGILNFCSMVFLLSYTNLGGYAVVGTTLVINGVSNLFITPFLAQKFLKLKKNPFYIYFIRHIICCVAMTYILSIINTNLTINRWIDFLVCGFINAAIAIVGSFTLLSIMDGTLYKKVRMLHDK